MGWDVSFLFLVCLRSKKFYLNIFNFGHFLVFQNLRTVDLAGKSFLYLKTQLLKMAGWSEQTQTEPIILKWLRDSLWSLWNLPASETGCLETCKTCHFLKTIPKKLVSTSAKKRRRLLKTECNQKKFTYYNHRNHGILTSILPNGEIMYFPPVAWIQEVGKNQQDVIMMLPWLDQPAGLDQDVTAPS